MGTSSGLVSDGRRKSRHCCRNLKGSSGFQRWGFASFSEVEFLLYLYVFSDDLDLMFAVHWILNGGWEKEVSHIQLHVEL
ncbi:hypothetical protein COLO4_23455 [Corchorus olitorius]|uniref:Uncharacterized protein n=1 Tax=Corchorus olitorius TaxID=93759 RepID=A0A1R3IGF7_9ROSI|nr:hypothetical protein COLO4_23455 [Corchorus olitorius]